MEPPPTTFGSVQRRAPSPSTSSVLVPIAKKLLAPTPKKVAGLGLYVLGIFLCCFFVPPVVPPERLEEYSRLMKKANSVPGFHEAQEQLQLARLSLEEDHVFFWSWREPYKYIVPQKKAVVRAAEAKVERLYVQRADYELSAKKKVGLLSSFAVEEARNLFWDLFERGKIFAKRQTFWNGLMIVLESRDGNLFSFLLEWLLALLVNFTVGLFGAFIAFVLMVYKIVFAYSSDPVSGMLFYAGCVLAGLCMVVTYVVGMYGAAGTAVYCAVTSVASQARLQAARQRQRQNSQYLREQAYYRAGHRPHFQGSPGMRPHYQ